MGSFETNQKPIASKFNRESRTYSKFSIPGGYMGHYNQPKRQVPSELCWNRGIIMCMVVLSGRYIEMKLPFWRSSFKHNNPTSFQPTRLAPQEGGKHNGDGKCEALLDFYARYKWCIMGQSTMDQNDINQPDFGHWTLGFCHIWGSTMMWFHEGLSRMPAMISLFIWTRRFEWCWLEWKRVSRTQMVTKFRFALYASVWNSLFLPSIDAPVISMYFPMHQSTFSTIAVTTIYNMYIEWVWIVQK